MTELTDETERLTAQALAHLRELLTAARLDASAAVESREGDNLTLAITGPEARLLVGPQGQTLNASFERRNRGLTPTSRQGSR